MRPNPLHVQSLAEPTQPQIVVLPVGIHIPPQPVERDPNALPAIDNAAELVASNILPLPPELIEGLLHQGLKAVLGSSSKARKTWILLDLALSVATGTRWWDLITTQGKVLYINFEIAKPFICQRIKRLVEAKQLNDISNLHIWTLRGHSAPFEKLVPKMLKDIAKAAYALIIIDPVYKGLAGKDENSAGDVSELCNQLEKLAVQTGAAVIYAHHFSKGNQSKKEPMDRIGGSGAFARDADTIITLTKHDNDDCYTVDTVLRNLPEKPPFVVEWQYPLMVTRLGLDPAKLKGKGGKPKEDHTAELLLLLKEKPLKTTEWQKKAAEAGISKSTFYAQFKVMKLGNYFEEVPGTETWRACGSGRG